MTFLTVALIVTIEVIIVFVDGVVGQVLEEVSHVLATSFFILLCCESTDAFLEDIDAKRVDSIDQDVDSKVEFEAIDEKRIV
jgi:hypothetical protein